MSRSLTAFPIGAHTEPNGLAHFRVWAPDPTQVSLVIERAAREPDEVAMTPEDAGYYSAAVEHVHHGDRYWFRLDGDLVPDPASRFQPEGPFGPSQVIDPRRYPWTDAGWRGVRIDGQVIYELHVGTFTPEGTWQAAAEKLPLLAEIGITVVEVMPVAEFPGRFGWGYDGVFPYAPTRLYGSPDDFRAFVDRAHLLGLGVILDVVYNHLGPDGCVFGRYARRYYTNRFENEWGDSLNFDAAEARPARDYWSGNAAYWIRDFHLDGLRLDATQSVQDTSEPHILAEINDAARAAADGRPIILVAENEPQHVRLVHPRAAGGYGLDALWNDDFHHSAVVALTGKREAYYSDHHGTPQELISAVKHGYLFQGQRYAWQKQPRGSSTRGLASSAFVNFTENHDQVANSSSGTRLRLRTSPGRYRALAALTFLMPGTPMLFQGQEFGATTPFLYFADHRPELAEAVRKGRATFVSQFPSAGAAEMQARLAAPHDVETFTRSRLDWAEYERHDSWRRFHRDLIALRRNDPTFRAQRRGTVDGAVLAPEAFVLRYMAETAAGERLVVVNLGADLAQPSFAEPLVAPPGGYAWSTQWSTESPEYGGEGTAPVVGPDGWRIPGHAAVVLQPELIHGSDGTHRR